MSRIDIAELSWFLHTLKNSNDEARFILKKVQAAAQDYADDHSLIGQAIKTS
ncbi:hypothetical protein [Listeria seeligeri]|uniref:hypothetical protein n=1 Tax=Listeria seeligeri TaxID=1640 RepID=UPI0018871281|nr:hypothetical protein [Listeria seeligeri]MBF2642367.1 hypothetical protein [Listeria seeligeri]